MSSNIYYKSKFKINLNERLYKQVLQKNFNKSIKFYKQFNDFEIGKSNFFEPNFIKNIIKKMK